MNSKQIEQYLQALNVKLEQLGASSMSIVLLGGALMVTQLKNRAATQDIDVVLATSSAQVYQTFKKAISLVAQEEKLAEDWMNDDVTFIVDQIGKPKSPTLWRTYSKLDVYIPELEYVLALKLFSARPQDDRESKY